VSSVSIYTDGTKKKSRSLIQNRVSKPASLVEQYSPCGRLVFFLQFSQMSVRRASKMDISSRPKTEPPSVRRYVDNRPRCPGATHPASFRLQWYPPSFNSCSFLLTPSPSNPQNKVDNNRQQQRNSQHCGTKAIIKAALASHADALRAPVESDKSVDHGRQRDEREEAGADLADAVTEVEQADGQAAEDDGEVEP
jgi:hypothetical protein